MIAHRSSAVRAFAVSAVCLIVLLCAAPGRSAEDPKFRGEGKHVLVVYAQDGADQDGNGKPDSQDAAEYYAQRRAVPRENLLGLKLQAKGRGGWVYGEFFDLILKPVAAKLAENGPDGKPLSERLAYMLLCPGIPDSMDTGQPAAKDEKSWFRKTRRRSVDGYLIALGQNLSVGVGPAGASRPASQPATQPGPGRDGPLGAAANELVLPIFSLYANPSAGLHFRQLRQTNPQQFGFYLVNRLGLDLPTARNMLDGALYAERYLRLPEPTEQTPFRPTIWLDQKYGFAGDQVASLTRCIPLVQGAAGSPFAAGTDLRRLWPLVIDNQPEEIGLVKDGRQHPPTVTARIAPNGVGEKALTLVLPSQLGRGQDAPAALYFPIGCTITNKPLPKPAPATTSGPASAPIAEPPADAKTYATARVLGFALPPGQPTPATSPGPRAAAPEVPQPVLLVDSTKGFAPGDTISCTWPGTFPTDTCFYFFGFYGLGQYEDVFQFLPGAMGIHVDSSCMVWASAAIRRGIAGTFGVTTEPLSSGIPYGDLVLSALAQGYDWAEASYAGLRFGQRWTGVVFGDPIYAPFRSRMMVDKTSPVIGPAEVKPGPKAAGKAAVTLTAGLAGASEDELADVAQFKLEYGPTDKYGAAVEFFAWPVPEQSKQVAGRRWSWSRHFAATIKDLEPGKTYHYRLTARDPAGNQSSTNDATFTP